MLFLFILMCVRIVEMRCVAVWLWLMILTVYLWILWHCSYNWWQKMNTGEIEILADGVKVLNRCNATLPFHIHNFHEVCLSLISALTVLNMWHFLSYICYSAPWGEQCIVMRISVCLCDRSVWPLAYLENGWTELHEIFCAHPLGRGSVLLRWRDDMLCTLWTEKNVAAHLWSWLWKMLMDFKNFYIFGNRNEWPLQVGHLHILVSYSATCVWD